MFLSNAGTKWITLKKNQHAFAQARVRARDLDSVVRWTKEKT
jgi:hypothetical protein